MPFPKDTAVDVHEMTLGDTKEAVMYAIGRVIALEAAGGDSVPLATQLDDVGGGVTYVGEAVPGTATASALWRIKRIVETGPDIAIAWADGDSDQDNVWDDRVSLSYS